MSDWTNSQFKPDIDFIKKATTYENRSHDWQELWDDQGRRTICSQCGAVFGRDYIVCIPRQ